MDGGYCVIPQSYVGDCRIGKGVLFLEVVGVFACLNVSDSHFDFGIADTLSDSVIVVLLIIGGKRTGRKRPVWVTSVANVKVESFARCMSAARNQSRNLSAFILY